MELNWSTFVLEIVNFLVLIWILKRFLYQPVLAVIAARRKSIEDRLEQAHAVEAEASRLREQFDGRLAEWEAERQRAREDLSREIEQERVRLHSDLRAELEHEREKARIATERERLEQRRLAEQQALQHSAAFASRLLSVASGPELEARLLSLVVQEIESLSDEQLRRLREQWGESAQEIHITSAWPLSEDQRDRLTRALEDAFGEPGAVQFREDPQLLAGLCIVIGSWVLGLNVRDELAGFTELARAPR